VGRPAVQALSMLRVRSRVDERLLQCPSEMRKRAKVFVVP
jgi:hypothetical protein